MKISELEGSNTFDLLRVRILSRQGPNRVGSRARGMKFVWNLLIADDTGTSVLSLWGVNTGENFKVGQVIGITNGWCKLFNGQKQVSLGREGQIKILPDDPSLPRQIDP